MPPLWQPGPERRARADVTAFLQRVSREHGVELDDYHELVDWSCRELEAFWTAVWDHGEVVAATRGDVVLEHADRMPGARFFPGARLNFAENLLRRRGDDDAVVFWAEDVERRHLSWDDLRLQVACLAGALRDLGVEAGDVVAAFMPNMPETIVAMLAAASLGAVFTSCSPDFGPRGVVDRFGQVEPKILFCADGYPYKGRKHDSLLRVARFLPDLASIEHVIVTGYLKPWPDLAPLRATYWQPSVHNWNEIMSRGEASEPDFVRLPFDHPLYVMFSSGTTGKPKCIVHGAGGTLLKHLSEHRLMCDVRAGDRVFYFTTCGWMMWNWLVSALACEATLLLYDGNPFRPHAGILFDYADREGMTLFGTSAKYIDALRNAGTAPRDTHDLGTLRTITSTGSPLVPESFDYVYESVKEDLCLSSISGGTDIIGCFVGGNPIGPVWRGEIQSPVPGMAVDVFDPDGRPLRGAKGELVCKRPFPSMPVRFWGDPDGSRYRAAYFGRYPGIWHHGDFAELTEHGGVIIHGRSDATLNPGGVRIGTAEIYRQVETLPEVQEALAIGQEWNDDVRIVLFVVLEEGRDLDDDLVERIKDAVRSGCSPRHVPARVLQVTDIPRTKSGKITELAVRDVVHGRPVENRHALANPEALEQFADRPELQR